MKSNYKERKKEVDEFDNVTHKVASKAPTIETETKLTNEKIFGDNFVTVVREKIGADKILLTDEIIKADLHLETAISLCGKLLRTDKYKANETEIREIAIMYLCASICKALFSRVKDIKFRSYADNDYWQKYIDFIYPANNKKVALMSKLGLK